MVSFWGFLPSWSLTSDSHKWPFHRGHLWLCTHLAAARTPPCTGDAQGARRVLQGERQVLGTACRHERGHSDIYIRQGALFSNIACCAACETPKKTMYIWASCHKEQWQDLSPAVHFTHMHQGWAQPQQHHSALQASGLKGTEHQERKLHWV